MDTQQCKDNGGLIYHGYLAYLYSLIFHLIVRGSKNLCQPTQGLHLLALLYIVHVWMPWWLTQSSCINEPGTHDKLRPHYPCTCQLAWDFCTIYLKRQDIYHLVDDKLSSFLLIFELLLTNSLYNSLLNRTIKCIANWKLFLCMELKEIICKHVFEYIMRSERILVV
jgi:hypothetical protein